MHATCGPFSVATSAANKCRMFGASFVNTVVTSVAGVTVSECNLLRSCENSWNATFFTCFGMFYLVVRI